MSELMPIVTDRYGATIIKSMIDDYRTDMGGGPVRSEPDRSSLVVRLLTAIAAGSTTPVTAEIMRLNGLTWEGTGQTVQVRSATGLAVTTTGRRIARKCGQFGWVVVET